MKRMMVVLTIAAVLVAMVAAAGPAMAQNPNKAAKRAAKQANKQAQGIRNVAPANGGMQKAIPAKAGAQKALPASGGIPAGTVALLGAGTLMIGSGLLVRRAARQ